MRPEPKIHLRTRDGVLCNAGGWNGGNGTEARLRLFTSEHLSSVWCERCERAIAKAKAGKEERR